MGENTGGPTQPLQPMTQGQPPEELYMLVLAGNHDPRQHHPYWYKLTGVLDDAEVKVAISNPLIVTPDFATFGIADFAISCDHWRWQIVTPRQEKCERMVSVATKVFDEKLYQTSIIAIGTNCHFNPVTAANEVGKVVAGAAERSGLIPEIEGKTDGSAIIVAGTVDRMLRIELGQSTLGADRVSVAFNVHRNLQTRQGYYAIAGELQHCESDWRHGRRFAEEVVNKINALSRK